MPSERNESMISEVKRWIADDPDPACRAELEQLLSRNDLDALVDRFAESLKFGTALNLNQNLFFEMASKMID